MIIQLQQFTKLIIESLHSCIAKCYFGDVTWKKVPDTALLGLASDELLDLVLHLVEGLLYVAS